MKMEKYEEIPKKVKAIQVTKDNVVEIAEMVGGVVLWNNGRLFAYGTTYPCVEWNTSPNDAEGYWVGQGDWVVSDGAQYKRVGSAAFYCLYRKRR